MRSVEDALGRVFHLANPTAMPLPRLTEWLCDVGYPLRPLPFAAWKQALIESPAFEENALYPFAPFLSELEETDSLMAQAICARTFAVLEAGGVGCPPVDEALRRELMQWVVKEIGALARPDEIRFTDALPKTRSGKIMRRLLRDIAAGRESVGDTTTLEDYSVLASLRQEEE